MWLAGTDADRPVVPSLYWRHSYGLPNACVWPGGLALSVTRRFPRPGPARALHYLPGASVRNRPGAADPRGDADPCAGWQPPHWAAPRGVLPRALSINPAHWTLPAGCLQATPASSSTAPGWLLRRTFLYGAGQIHTVVTHAGYLQVQASTTKHSIPRPWTSRCFVLDFTCAGGGIGEYRSYLGSRCYDVVCG